MSERNDREEPGDLEDEIVPGAGVGGQIVVPADNSFFGPGEAPPEDDQGTNEEDLSPEDDPLTKNPGESPDFDHSLRRYKQS